VVVGATMSVADGFVAPGGVTLPRALVAGVCRAVAVIAAAPAVTAVPKAAVTTATASRMHGCGSEKRECERGDGQD
jgi:hypothetical protein